MWNVRGLNSPMKHNEIRLFLYHYKIGLFRFLETRVKAVSFPKVFPKICSSFSVVTNYMKHRGGRIWLVWLASNFAVNIKDCSAQHIHCVVTHKATGRVFAVTMVYGFNDASERNVLWADLVNISKSITGA